MLRIALALVSTLIALLLSEVYLQLFASVPPILNRTEEWLSHVRSEVTGWAPAATADYRDTSGMLLQQSTTYPGVPSIAVLGDSVVEYGDVTRPLAHMIGNRLSIHVFGTTGFDALQSIDSYRHTALQPAPTAILFFFHPNDFDPSVVALRDGDGTLQAVNSRGLSLPTSAWLIQQSIVFRYLMFGILSIHSHHLFAPDRVQQFFTNAKLWQKNHPASRFILIALPWFKKESLWSTREKDRHQRTLALAAESGFCAIDLLPLLRCAEQSNLPLSLDAVDVHHPSPALAAVIAEYLHTELFTVDGRVACPVGPSPHTVANCSQRSS